MKAVLLILTMLFIITLSAQNQMSMLLRMRGEMGAANFGYQMTSLDFNADGFNDLVVLSNGWGPDNVANGYGKVLVYYGSAVLDTIPDLILEGNQTNQHMYDIPSAVGDVNGDGFEDLVITEKIDGIGYVRFCYGGHNPDLLPDYEMQITATWDGPELFSFTPLGDINHDGYDDIGCHRTLTSSHYDICVMLGGSYVIYTLAHNVTRETISGLGDVNGDGYPDFMVGYQPILNGGFPRVRYVYYGSDGLNLDNRVLLMESYEINMVFPGGYGIGDLNGDGYNDMAMYRYPYTDEWIYFKLGSLNILDSNEYDVSNSEYFSFTHAGQAYGDFNGDGFSDLLGANYSYGLWEGVAGIWMGRATPNGLYDLRIDPPQDLIFYQFGWSVVTGDFNGDGCCDIAISAPNSTSGTPGYPGFVMIYAGNPALHDTTVGIDENTMTPISDNIRMEIYPNPATKKSVILNIQLTGNLPKDINVAGFDLYNVKGQVILHLVLSHQQLRQQTISMPEMSLSPGVYLGVITINDARVTTSKLTIK